MTRSGLWWGGLLALALVAPAHAASVSGSITNSASISNTCVNTLTGNFSFGKYDPLIANKTAPLDATAQVNVTCTYNTYFAYSIDFGGFPTTACTNNLRMRSGAGGYINYAIYRDVARTNPWPGYTPACGGTYNNTTSTSSTVAQSFPLYGRIPGGQTTVAATTYYDSVIFTVTY